MMKPDMLDFSPIGIIQSCFSEKFGIPRQPGLVREARASLQLLPPCDRPETVEGLEAFSHLWIVFVFHATAAQSWKPTVRPPRLGGNRRVGVFASRTMFRPNPIGLSVVELEAITFVQGSPVLHLAGVDLLDGTPVLDIKPYIPYSDSLPEARAGYAVEPPRQQLMVSFTPEVQQQCRQLSKQYPDLQTLIHKLLQLDPRPAYRKNSSVTKEYGMRLYDFDVKWVVEGVQITVTAIEK